MSNDSSSSIAKKQPVKNSGQVPWNPWLGVLFTILLFICAQLFASIVVAIIPHIAGWSDSRSTAWLKDSLESKLILLSATTIFVLVPIYYYLKRHKVGFKAIGLRKPKWSDPLYSLAALPLYIFSFAIIVALVKFLVPGLDVNQAQDLGFNSSHYSLLQLVLIAVVLVVLPPITEEIVFRGMLYGSLKKGLPVLIAALLTSFIFASGHLLESGDNSLLYIAAIDTFVLSLILVGLREITGGLWSSIGLHAIKNGIAFVSLFVLHLK